MSGRKLGTRQQLGIAGRSEGPNPERLTNRKTRKKSGTSYSRMRQGRDSGKAGKMDVPKAGSKEAADPKLLIARARRDLDVLADKIAVTSAQLELARQERARDLYWKESAEERCLRLELALLSAKKRNISRWISSNANGNGGKKTNGNAGAKRAVKKMRRDPATKGVSSGSGRKRVSLIG